MGIDLTQRLNEIRAIENVLKHNENRIKVEAPMSETSSPLRREETEEYENFLNFQAIHQQHQPPKPIRTSSL